MSEAPGIECRDLVCGYPERRVLENLDLKLLPGTVTALLGPNGSGKSTLLRTIAGLIPALSGEVLVAGRSVARMTVAERARQIAMVPQEEAVPYRFLVRDVVTMGRIPHSTGFFDTEEDRAVAADAMRQADCLELSSRPITELSGGEKQRVLLARAIAQSADVLLLDEPTSHLDVAHQLTALELVRKLAGAGRTVVAAIHDLNLASAIADRGVLLSEARVVREGPIREILESKDLDQVFAASFERVTISDGRLCVLPRGEGLPVAKG
jgi:iron complex transport system ATP-binding protein